MKSELIRLLNKVLVTHAPGGWEQEMDAVILEELDMWSDALVRDQKGNLLLKIQGRKREPLTMISAHKDEISVMVHKIDEDGRIWLEPVGGIRPQKYGEGPFDLLTEKGVIEGILHMGCAHTSERSPRVHALKTQVATWDLVYLDCKLRGEDLEKRGVSIGDRAVVARSRKKPMILHDQFIGGFALDDKAAVVVLLLLAKALHTQPVMFDTILAFTCEEEAGVTGAQFACRNEQPQCHIALEVAPVAEEYTIKMTDDPVIFVKDGLHYYHNGMIQSLNRAARASNVSLQRAAVRTFGSEASKNDLNGLVAMAACLGFPTENTHGYEVAPLGAMLNCYHVLKNYCTNAPLK